MSDKELIAQLRNSKGWPTLGNAAADRIEALEQQVADLLADVPCACGYDNPTDVCMKHLPLVRNLTAKLEKAVEALRFGVDLIKGDSFGHEWKKGQADFRRMARAALAEIEGEKT
jgi:hypothetical protein